MKKKKLDKKKRRTTRTKDWELHHEHSFTHDRARHRKAQVTLTESAKELGELPAGFFPNGMVLAHSKKWAFVQFDGKEQLCLIDERLQERDATLLAPGDEVWVDREEQDLLIRGVAPRRTKLSRPAGIHARVGEQIVAANVDLLLVIAAVANPPMRQGLIDRYLIAAERGGVEPVLIVNKMDLVPCEPPEVAAYRELGIRVINTSCTTGEGVEALRDALRGKLSVLSGHSGVGKSSLLMALDPALDLNTQEVSESSSKGRHTTTAARLYELRDAVRIIDTPGIRTLGLWSVAPEEVSLYFPEIADATAGCQFRDCTHTHEPRCGVKQALEQNLINPARYLSYLRIRASLESEKNLTPGRMGAAHALRLPNPDDPSSPPT